MRHEDGRLALDVVVRGVVSGEVVVRVEVVAPGRPRIQSADSFVRTLAFPCGALSARGTAKAIGYEFQGGSQICVRGEDDPSVVAAIDGVRNEVDGELNIDALLASLFGWPRWRVTKCARNDHCARPLPGSALAHVGRICPGLLPGLRPARVDADFAERTHHSGWRTTTNEGAECYRIDLPGHVTCARTRTKAVASAAIDVLGIDVEDDPVRHGWPQQITPPIHRYQR